MYNSIFNSNKLSNNPLFNPAGGTFTFNNITANSNTATWLATFRSPGGNVKVSNYNGSGNNWNGVMTFDDVTNAPVVVDGCQSNDLNPGFFIQAGGTSPSFALTNSAIYNGVVSIKSKGAIIVQNNQFLGSAFTSNIITNVLQHGSFSSFTLQNCSFNGYTLNSSAIMLNGTGPVTIYNSTFSGMTLGRGCVVVGGGGACTVDGCSFKSIYNPTNTTDPSVISTIGLGEESHNSNFHGYFCTEFL